jgi:hypothetical protein
MWNVLKSSKLLCGRVIDSAYSNDNRGDWFYLRAAPSDMPGKRSREVHNHAAVKGKLSPDKACMLERDSWP